MRDSALSAPIPALSSPTPRSVRLSSSSPSPRRFASFDETLLKAGAILGAGPVRVFRMIMLPLILPGVVSGAIFAFATSWDEVVIVLFLAGPEQHTIPRRMWSGMRDNLSPTIIAAATLLIASFHRVDGDPRVAAPP